MFQVDDNGNRQCNSCGITFDIYQDGEGLLNLEEILDCAEQQQKQWQQKNPKIDLLGYFCCRCADLTIRQIEENKNENEITYC